MPLPRPLLALEAFEDRALPSGGFGNHAYDSRGGWDATPGMVRDHHSRDDGHGAPGYANERGFPSAAPGQVLLVIEVVAVRTATARAQTSVPAAVAAGVSEPATEPVATRVALPPDTDGVRDAPPQLTAAPAPTRSAVAPTPDARPGGPASSVAVVPLFGSDTPDQPPAPGAPAPPSVTEAPIPRVPDVSPFDDWKPIVAQLPGVPIAGWLGLDTDALEGGMARLLDLAGGVEVDGADAGGWRLWLTAGAVLGGCAGYAAWASRGARPTRTGSRWEERHDA